MTPASFLRAALYPVTNTGVLISLATFWLLYSFSIWGGMLGLILLFLILPFLFRYQVAVLEARAVGREPETPGVEYFTWTGNVWTLWTAVLNVAAIGLVGWSSASFGPAGLTMALIAVSILLPASLSVLAITHSPLQSINPLAIGRLLARCRANFWVASIYLLLAGGVSLLAESLPFLVANALQIFLLFSLMSVIGSVIAPYDLVDDVYIPDAAPPDPDGADRQLEKDRVAVLTHAYAFISRNNRDGGFKHVFSAIEQDPQPLQSWHWYFDRMLQWDNQQHALFFAQHAIHDMLAHGEVKAAMKLSMRCHLIDERFTPRRDDLPALLAAAERAGNSELTALLKTM